MISGQDKHIQLEAGQIQLLTAQIADLERQPGQDPSNSSPPPASDSPYAKKPAKTRSPRQWSGHKPGK